MTDGPNDQGMPPQGGMRFQDQNTRPREPTLAERKAREQAQRRREETERQAAEAAERSRRKKKRILIGAGATVGLAAVIGIGYAISQADDVTARCVDDTGVVVDDGNCVTPAASSSHYYGGGAYPVFIGTGGRQYHYNYGGNGTVGQPVSGGTTSVPRDSTRVVTSSGRTVSGGVSGSSVSSGDDGGSGSSGKSSVSRGGLGSSSSGSSSGS